MFTRIAAACVLILITLSLIPWLSETVWGVNSAGTYLLRALIVSAIVVTGIWWLRTRRDGLSMADLGAPGMRRALPEFGRGVGIVALPLAAVSILGDALGWADVSMNLSWSALGAIGIGATTVLLFEAVPEELVFRGYIYRSFSSRHRRWVAAILTTALFVSLPLVLVQIQSAVFGLEINIGGNSSITAPYLITLTIFGSFVLYLRVLTDTIWTGVGFHFAFVYMNRLMGPDPDNVLQFAEINNSMAMQITGLGTVGLLLVFLLVYPWIVGRKVGWNEVDPDSAPL
jgi:membrane protease YdiL (CAAX protease family)